MKKVFDFDHEDFKKNGSATRVFMKLIYGSNLTQTEFAERYKKMKPTGTPPSYLRNVYGRLKKNYDFFA